MAIKSNNTKGNPYHDESTGEFTRKDGKSSKADKNVSNGKYRKISSVDKNFTNKENASEFLSRFLKQKNTSVEPINTEVPKTIEEVALQANRDILGTNSKVVTYNKDTSIEVALQFNQALKHMKDMFPKIFEGLLYFGNSDEIFSFEDFDSRMEYMQKTAENILNSHQYQNLLATKNLNKEDVMKILNTVWLHSSLIMERKERWTYPDGIVMGYARGQNITTKNRPQTYKTLMSHINETVEKPLFGLSTPIAPFGYIKFNPELTTLEKWEIKANDDYAKPSPTKQGLRAYSTGIHELGHFVDGVLGKFFSDVDIQELDEILRKDNVVKVNISKYAATNVVEHVAEAFLDVFSAQNPTEHNKKIVNFYKKMYDKYFNQPVSQKEPVNV